MLRGEYRSTVGRFFDSLQGKLMKATRFVDARTACAAACLVSMLVSRACGESETIATGPWAAAAEVHEAASDDRDVDAFFDGFFARQLKELGIPGAVIVWVRDGAVRHATGYGMANRATAAPVDYEQTVFRLASVSKLFTALCALQLAETGKLDLDTDVNRYLQGMHVGSEEFGPVTPSRLLVHTGGVDERLLGYLTRDPRQVANLGGYLKTWMPPQTRPAGVVATYSNHGYALLGYLVERQSGLRFDAYAATHVFEPLGMRRSAFLVPPVPGWIASSRCPGYWATGDLVEAVWSRPYPAGALATTGGDMARFIVAFLAAVRGQSSEVFRPSVVTRMTGRRFSHRPDIPGYTLGLAEMSLFGQRVLLKGGSAPGHSAVIAFIPERDAGLFVAVNRQEPQLWTRLLPELVKHEFPKAVQSTSTPPETRPLDRFAGEYRAMRYANASFERVLSLAMHVRVEVVDGKIHLLGPDVDLPCEPTAEPLVFSSEPGRYVAFHEDDRGRIDQMFLNVDGDHLAAERLGFWQRTDTVVFSLLAACAVLVFAGSFQAVATVWRRIRQGKFRPATGALGPLVSAALAAAIVTTLAACYWSVVPLTNFLYGPSLAIWLALTGANLMALLAMVMFLEAGRQLVGRKVGAVRRVARLVVCSACIIVIVFLIEFNLIGYRI